MLPELKSLGASLVAISPELPDKSLTFKEKNELEYEVLSDHQNEVARSYGLVFTLDEHVQDVFVNQFSLDIAGWNGEDSWELPIPATYVVGQNSMIGVAFVDPDYTQRLEPDDVLAGVRQLAG